MRNSFVKEQDAVSDWFVKASGYWCFSWCSGKIPSSYSPFPSCQYKTIAQPKYAFKIPCPAWEQILCFWRAFSGAWSWFPPAVALWLCSNRLGPLGSRHWRWLKEDTSRLTPMLCISCSPQGACVSSLIMVLLCRSFLWPNVSVWIIHDHHFCFCLAILLFYFSRKTYIILLHT